MTSNNQPPSETGNRLQDELQRCRKECRSLRKADNIYRSIYRKSALGIFEFSADGRLTDVNQAFADMFGFGSPAEALAGLKPLVDSRLHSGALVKLIEAQESGQYDITLRRKDGSLFPGSAYVHAIRDAGGETVCFYGFIEDISQRKLREDGARSFSQRLISLMEEDRRRLACDVHDELGQQLSGLYFTAENLYGSLPEELHEQRSECRDLMAMVSGTADTMRELLSRMRPEMLDDLGLVPAMESFIAGFQSRHAGIEVSFTAENAQGVQDAGLRIVLYRILQESLTNVARHARADRVAVALGCTECEVMLTITDNGVGFEPRMDDFLYLAGLKTKSMGLMGIRERAASVGGSAHIRSGRGQGTTVRVTAPLGREARDE